ncbi:ankyrin repeat domain-containing protein [Legionella sp. CNM-1927-20]|uniref:ankyrin repeat domain-containing protein n=1 Tax=Legionella sp. CNM-1927-20 TaxID=3422221 RepID=UPI00403B2816
MENSNRHGLNFEKLRGPLGEQKIYTIRHNKKSRIALCPIESKEGQVWVVTDILPNHEYPHLTPLDDEERRALTAALNQDITDNNNNTNSEKEEVEETDFVLSSRVEFCNKQFILLDEGQEEVRIKGKTSLPLIISGAPGSGKTSVLLAIIKQNIMHWCEERGEPPRILVIAKSTHLVHQLRQEWASICEVEFKGTTINPNCVEFKTPEEIYTLNHGAANFKGEGDFIQWYNHYAATQLKLNAREKSALPVEVSEAPLIYQEFYTMSAYDSFETYNSLVSSKFSLFSDEKTRAWLWHVYQSYLKKLADNQEVDLAFHPIELTEHYDFIGADETQDLSRQQIKSLVHRKPLSQNDVQADNLIFCVGDHQRLFGSETTLPFIRSIFWEKYQKDVTTHAVLQASYRCPKEVIEVSNAVLQFKYQAIGGASFLDKNELAYVGANQALTQHGTVHWLDKKDELTPLMNDRDNVHFIVITSEEFLTEAIDLFGRERVYTPTSVKGLQAKHVLLYRFLEQDGFKAANPIIGENFMLQNQPTTVAKTSDGSIRHSTLFNEFFVATTRAEVSLSIYQPPVRGIHFIRDPLKDFVEKNNHSKTHTQSLSTHSSKEEWLAHAQYLKERGQEEQAKAIEARFKEPENKVTEQKVTVNSQASIQAAQIPTQTTPIGKKKKGKQPLHPIEEVLLNKPGAIDKLLTDNNVRHYLFHTYLKTINESWPDCSLLEYLEKPNPKHAKVKDKLMDELKWRLERICQWRAPIKEQQNQQDDLMGLLSYKPNNAASSLAQLLLKRLKPNTPAQQFMQTFMRNRRSQLDEQLEKGNSQAVVSLQYLGLLNAFNKDDHTPMHIAALANKAQIITQLKKLGAEVDKPNKNGTRPLYLAAYYGNVAAIKALISAGAKVDECTETGATSLYVAAQNGHEAAVEAIIIAGVNVDKPNKSSATPLYAAALNGHGAVITKLVKLGKADVNKAAEDGSTSLHAAVHNGHVEAIKTLVSLGATVDIPNQNGATPLYIAAQNGHVEAVRALVELGADVNKACGAMNQTPLHAAAQNGHLAVIKELLSLGTKVKVDEPNKNGTTPLYLAAQKGHVGAIIALVKFGKADVNKVAYDNYTPLHIAAQMGYGAAIKALLSLGAKVKVDEPNKNGATPLYLAALYGQVEAIEVLVKLGEANVNKACANNNTPLHCAAYKGHVEAIKTLVSLGATVDISSQFGVTPLHCAATAGHAEAIKTLVSLGATVDILNQFGTSPLYIAALNGHLEAVKTLVSLGANVNQPTQKGVTPLYTAAKNGHTDIVSYLLASDACCFKAWQSSSKELITTAEKLGPDILTRAKEFITNKGQVLDSNDSLPILPHEVAHIMGHKEIEQLILNKMASLQSNADNRYTFFSSQATSDASTSDEQLSLTT